MSTDISAQRGLEQDAPRPPRQLPQPTTESQPFWDACARHELVMQRCDVCGRFWFPPSNHCQHCWSPRYTWQALSGRGDIHTFTVYRRAYSPELVDQLPYVVAVVDLEEGPRLISNIVGCEPETVRVGMPVEVTFTDIAEGVALHAFQPRQGPVRQDPAASAAQPPRETPGDK